METTVPHGCFCLVDEQGSGDRTSCKRNIFGPSLPSAVARTQKPHQKNSTSSHIQMLGCRRGQDGPQGPGKKGFVPDGRAPNPNDDFVKRVRIGRAACEPSSRLQLLFSQVDHEMMLLMSKVQSRCHKMPNHYLLTTRLDALLGAGIILGASDCFLGLMGLPSSKVVGSHLFGLVDPDWFSFHHDDGSWRTERRENNVQRVTDHFMNQRSPLGNFVLTTDSGPVMFGYHMTVVAFGLEDVLLWCLVSNLDHAALDKLTAQSSCAEKHEGKPGGAIAYCHDQPRKKTSSGRINHVDWGLASSSPYKRHLSVPTLFHRAVWNFFHDTKLAKDDGHACSKNILLRGVQGFVSSCGSNAKTTFSKFNTTETTDFLPKAILAWSHWAAIKFIRKSFCRLSLGQANFYLAAGCDLISFMIQFDAFLCSALPRLLRCRSDDAIVFPNSPQPHAEFAKIATSVLLPGNQMWFLI